jgi:hypothetical protein
MNWVSTIGAKTGRLLNRLGYTQLAEEASRVLPDPVDADQVSTWWMQHGLSRDDLISRMGGSP